MNLEVNISTTQHSSRFPTLEAKLLAGQRRIVRRNRCTPLAYLPQAEGHGKKSFSNTMSICYICIWYTKKIHPQFTQPSGWGSCLSSRSFIVRSCMISLSLCCFTLGECISLCVSQAISIGIRLMQGYASRPVVPQSVVPPACRILWSKNLWCKNLIYQLRQPQPLSVSGRHLRS